MAKKYYYFVISEADEFRTHIATIKASSNVELSVAVQIATANHFNTSIKLPSLDIHEIIKKVNVYMVVDDDKAKKYRPVRLELSQLY